jgi:hypothetical protein
VVTSTDIAIAAFDDFEDSGAMSDADAMVPVMAGLAARRMLTALVPSAMRASRPQATRRFGRALFRSLSERGRELVQRRGVAGLAELPQIAAHALGQVAGGEIRSPLCRRRFLSSSPGSLAR